MLLSNGDGYNATVSGTAEDEVMDTWYKSESRTRPQLEAIVQRNRLVKAMKQLMRVV